MIERNKAMLTWSCWKKSHTAFCWMLLLCLVIVLLPRQGCYGQDNQGIIKPFSKVIVPAVYHDWNEFGPPKWASDPETMAKYGNYSIFLYQKKDPTKPNYIQNRGTEGGVYLRYIVDHYDDFPDVAIFVHGHPEHHQPHFLDYMGCISPHANYINFNFDYHVRSTHYW